MDLLHKKCLPCEGGTKPLDEEAARKYLALAPGWMLEQGSVKMARELAFQDFKNAIAFINELAALAETEGHHPDINLFSWNHLKITLWTHAIGGLSENDFIIAVKANALLPNSIRSAPPLIPEHSLAKLSHYAQTHIL
ncbi:MAG: 4a-hydroxytetrahydrobiopterin dehydratase [Candidatus Kerfeldbacteria bacterium]|nr:4a-hydroxytetrahydrobiopterin dehydratase [Candidatus Kerfeldbacteria bacterium]